MAPAVQPRAGAGARTAAMPVSAALAAAAASSERTHIAGGDGRKEGSKQLHPVS